MACANLSMFLVLLSVLLFRVFFVVSGGILTHIFSTSALELHAYIRHNTIWVSDPTVPRSLPASLFFKTLISWKSKKLCNVSHSGFEAEYRPMVHIASEI